MTQRWIDVSPKHWFYRNVLEVDRLYLDHKKENTVIQGKLYNKFITGKSRTVHNFTTTEGQTSFKIKNYKPDSRELVIIYIDGVPYPPSKLESGIVHVGFPMAGGKEVSVYLSGVVDMKKGDHTPANCQTYPLTDTCELAYPSKKLEMAGRYVFSPYYSLNEIVVCMGKKLKRVNVMVANGESIQAALTRTIGHKRDCFTIIQGTLYVSYNLNGFPLLVNYNYKSGAVIKNRQKEKVVATSKCAMYNDRFFPEITVPRAEFFVILQRLRVNLYNKFTDRGYQPKVVAKTERYLADRNKIVGKWYDEDVLNILDEKFNDGCYVFPLYEDDSFQPEVCVTRAEAVVYLHRFMEWALERFR
ncbi:hypothetical protein [Metabacillus fastidiosus]|uniref:hypothetical protein n=1 Tax=Metabacillus fastidiosus TaxID=1458 RepID=UPI003D293CB2